MPRRRAHPGPYLKRMSRLTHTEYVLAGRSRPRPARHAARDDVRADGHRLADENACTVIARHERTPRVRLGVAATTRARSRASRRAPASAHDLDAPILIRTAYLDGRAAARAGRGDARAALRPYGEVSETHGRRRAC